MMRKSSYVILSILVFGIFISGCPKKVVKIMPIEVPPAKNPVDRILESFSSAETLQARTSIRIETVREGAEMKFLLNGFIIYQKPNRIRLLGYHPLGMGLFDALYINGEFFLLIPLQKRAYTGEISQFEHLIEKAGPIEIFSEGPEGSDIPNRIRIHIVEKETRIDIRLKDIFINPTLSEDSFDWKIPGEVEVKPLAQLLRKKRVR